MNNTINERGLVRSRLVFGIIPIFPILNTFLSKQKDRMNAIKTTEIEINSIIAEIRVLKALRRGTPPAAEGSYGEEVFVYNEDKKEWLGRLLFVDSTGRMITG